MSKKLIYPAVKFTILRRARYRVALSIDADLLEMYNLYAYIIVTLNLYRNCIFLIFGIITEHVLGVCM